MTLIQIIKLARNKCPHLPYISMGLNEIFYAYDSPPHLFKEIHHRGLWGVYGYSKVIGKYTGIPIDWQKSLIDVRNIKV